MIILCVACKRRVGYGPQLPTNCSYCGEAFPEKPVAAPPLLLGGLPMAKAMLRKEYKLSENDRRFLKSLRISQDVE